MLKLIIDRPAVSKDRHLCETCVHSQRMSGPGYQRFLCTQPSEPFEVRRQVEECSAYSTPDPYYNDTSKRLSALKRRGRYLIWGKPDEKTGERPIKWSDQPDR